MARTAALLYALALPATAAAAEADAGGYVASPGEVNALTVQVEPVDGAWAITYDDPGAEISSDSCETPAPHRLVCSHSGGAPVLRIHLGDGDDRLDASEARGVIVEAEAGDDYLVGSPEDDRFVDKWTLDDDVVDGAGGRDLFSYGDLYDPVTIRLDGSGASGAAGEKDLLRNIEDARGGQGADRIFGSAADNFIYPGWGVDVVRARGGDDSIALTQEPDRPAPEAERTDCGPGEDTVLGDGVGATGLFIVPACEELVLHRINNPEDRLSRIAIGDIRVRSAKELELDARCLIARGCSLDAVARTDGARARGKGMPMRLRATRGSFRAGQLVDLRLRATAPLNKWVYTYDLRLALSRRAP